MLREAPRDLYCGGRRYEVTASAFTLADDPAGRRGARVVLLVFPKARAGAQTEDRAVLFGSFPPEQQVTRAVRLLSR